MEESKENPKQEKDAETEDPHKLGYRAAYMQAKAAIEKLKEPIDELAELRDVLRDAAEKDRAGSDPLFAKFLYEECGPGITKLMAKERSNNQKVSSRRTSNQSRIEIISCFSYSTWKLWLVSLRPSSVFS